MGDSTVDTTLFFPHHHHHHHHRRDSGLCGRTADFNRGDFVCECVCVLLFFSSSFFYEDIERSDRRQLFGDSLFSLSLSLSSTLFHQVRSSRKGRCPTPERQFRKGNGLNGRTWATAASHPVISLKKTSRGKCDFPAQNAHIIHPACAQYPQLSA